MKRNNAIIKTLKVAITRIWIANGIFACE